MSSDAFVLACLEKIAGEYDKAIVVCKTLLFLFIFSVYFIFSHLQIFLLLVIVQKKTLLS
jgi:hypothetical protein